MIRITSVSLPLTYTDDDLKALVAKRLRVKPTVIESVKLARRAVDARKKDAIVFSATLDVALSEREDTVISRLKDDRVKLYTHTPYTMVTSTVKPSQRPVVIGSGPAGLFAALTLAKAGLCPILLERGEAVEQRRQTVEAFQSTGVLNTASNVQFGEGGAGTFSDGKLTTGIKDARCRVVLEAFAEASEGTAQDILWQAKPHLGTDRLFTIVRNLRRQILALGGEVRFSTQVTDLLVKDRTVTGLVLKTPQGEEELACDRVIVAIGHSARDTMAMLYERGVYAEQKSFAVGVRIEHPRAMINQSQYGRYAEHPSLGAADYKLSCRLPDGRGVYSFCMCPGGVVMAAASEEGGVCVNGMSEFARDAENSNSALLVGVTTEDMDGDHPLAGIALQRRMEQVAFRLGGNTYKAPAQCVGDFLKRRPTTVFGDVRPSYRPGVVGAELRECLPPFVAESLCAALPRFARQIEGFDRADAVLTGVEARSSSPVRFLRDENGQSSVYGVFPCGEGAGYAGGIMSAAVDGIRCAQWLINSLS